MRRIAAGPFGTFQYDPQQDRYRFDDAAREVLGELADPDASYQDMLRRMPPAVRRDYEKWRQQAARGQAGRVRVPFELPDRKVTLEVQIQPEGDQLRGLVTDVTDAERQHREMADQLSIMELAARLVRFGVWTYDVRQDRFVASREARELLRLDPARLTLEQALEQIHEDDRQAVREAHEKALETGQVQRVEFRRHGRWFVAESARVLDDEGEPVQTCGLVHETTHLHQHEALEQEHEHLKGLEEVRVRFFNTVAHELNQPLTPMRLQMATLRARLPENQEIHRGFQVIERNLERLSMMAQDLLDAARSQAGTLNVDLEPLDLPEHVSHVIDSLSDLAASREVRLAWRPEPTPSVRADPMRLQQCLSNLVHNAIKFTREGTEVRVRTETADAGVLVHVEDQGPGLDGQQVQAAFEPFQQVHRQPKGFYGTGLGLYVTRALMHAMGGTVDVEARPNGTCFCLCLPAA